MNRLTQGISAASRVSRSTLSLQPPTQPNSFKLQRYSRIQTHRLESYRGEELLARALLQILHTEKPGRAVGARVCIGRETADVILPQWIAALQIQLSLQKLLLDGASVCCVRAFLHEETVLRRRSVELAEQGSHGFDATVTVVRNADEYAPFRHVLHGEEASDLCSVGGGASELDRTSG